MPPSGFTPELAEQVLALREHLAALHKEQEHDGRGASTTFYQEAGIESIPVSRRRDSEGNNVYTVNLPCGEKAMRSRPP
ncbi:MAG: hypothetical protein ACLR8L_00040 [Oscillospiraceae bacterium]